MVSILAKLVASIKHSVKLLPKSLDSVVMADSAVVSEAALEAVLVVVSAAVSVASILTSSEIEI